MWIKVYDKTFGKVFISRRKIKKQIKAKSAVADFLLFFTYFACLSAGRFAAEREGFEPSVPVRVQHLSRVPHSTTLAPLHFIN